MTERFDPKAILKRLRADREAVPWAERRDIVSRIAETIREGGDLQVIMPLVEFLADDPKPEVRKEVAEMLQALPEREFVRLSAKLAEDDSFFVQKAVQRSLSRKRKGQERSSQPDLVGTGKDATHVIYGKWGEGKTYFALQAIAGLMSRQMTDKKFDDLVGATVHNMRGILSPMNTDLAVVLESLESGDPDVEECKESITKVMDRLEYLEKFIDDMRTYSHATPENLNRERFASLVGDARDMVFDELRLQGFDLDSVALRIDVPDNLTSEVCKHQIVIAIKHLLKNAYDAFRMPRARKRGRRIDVTAKLSDPEHVELIVQDNGPGLTEGTLADIRRFKIGNTVKKNQGGTGFGLPTVDKYAKSHGGSFAIDSRKGKGFTAILTLPIDQEGAQS